MYQHHRLVKMEEPETSERVRQVAQFSSTLDLSKRGHVTIADVDDVLRTMGSVIKQQRLEMERRKMWARVDLWLDRRLELMYERDGHGCN